MPIRPAGRLRSSTARAAWHWRRIAALMVAGIAASGLLAAPAVADWTPAVRLGEGFGAVVGFGPAGNAAVGFQAGHVAGDDVGGASTYLARRPAVGDFSTAVPVRQPGSIAALQSVLLPAGGGTVLLFTPLESDQTVPLSAVVEPAGASGFGVPQRLVPPRDNGAAGDPSVTLVGTARGDVVGATADEFGDVFTAVLARGASRFHGDGLSYTSADDANGSGLPLDGNGGLSLATDDVGGAFLAGNSADLSCAAVAYRPAGGHFGFVHEPPHCPRNSFCTGTRIAAGGDGYAALATVCGGGGYGPVRLTTWVGRAGRFGRAHVLATTPSVGFLGLDLGPPAVGERGNLTVAWDECQDQSTSRCSIAAARGNLHGGFGRSQTLDRGPQSTGLVGDGTVAVERCGRGGRCSISVALANRHGGFGRLQRITAHGQLQLLDGDARGDQIIVWTARNRSLYAATRRANAAHFGQPHRLSGSGVRLSIVTGAAEVSAAFGPRGKAIVAWSLRTGATFAAVYRVPR